MLLERLQITCLIACLVFCSCSSHVYPCKVISIKSSRPLKVLDYYGASIFGVDCPKSVPAEVLIPNKNYDIHMYFQANSNPKVFVGIEGASSSYQFNQQNWQVTSPQSVYKSAQYVKDIGQLIGAFAAGASSGGIDILTNPKLVSRRVVEFSITGPAGKSIKHSYPFSLVECKCRGYDAP